ncbi:diadenosine tetraphosphate (Ap4A) HIT family hydrolase [Paenibacillus cellulosilyticus]|uniref:Diadenosine tetraphosphate (Ap4A) HIT family hydrolase n=2 Tax=Paenibacillus cellulosilyticus TaxID=375489 RepID=A0A2V2YQ01_9BACL|nr:diadenosine tetraphosphate (Ap4A) HIT family hydrolase [Paenibacillus cellulosilyticus]QKS45028.1 HIT domain-containing protein [Paenibacillus cellulosilyticus]
MCCEYCYITLEHQHIMMDNETCMYLQLKEPEIIGSGIIIPKQHRETVFDLTEEEWLDTLALLQEVKTVLDAEYQPDGYNVGWNTGSVGGQHIFHAHLHVIPRFADEPFAGKGIRHWFKSQDNIRPVTP